MTENRVTTTDNAKVSMSLPDRLDSAIGDASSSIGLMMSELVRRSLHSGVAEIERTLEEVTAEKVTLAIDQQMPAISEAAQRIAETTSAKLITSVVSEAEGRTQEELQTVATQFQEAIRQANEENRHSVAQTTSELSDLESRARSSWKKLKSKFSDVASEFERTKAGIADVTAAQQACQTEIASVQQACLTQISAAHQKTKSELAEMTGEAARRKQQLSELTQGLQELSVRSERDLQEVMKQNQQLQERLEELERPRGLKAVWQKLQRKKSQPPAIDEADEEADEDS